MYVYKRSQTTGLKSRSCHPSLRSSISSLLSMPLSPHLKMGIMRASISQDSLKG